MNSTMTESLIEDENSIRVVHNKDPSLVSVVRTSVPITASDLISLSGLAPRDGSSVHINLDQNRASPDDLINPGCTVFIDNQSIIEPVIIDHISLHSRDGNIGTGVLNDGTIAHVPGTSTGDFCWVVRHIQHQSKRNKEVVHAQCHSFSLEKNPYSPGDLVRAQPAPDGTNALLFDPRTEEWTIHLEVSTPNNTDPEEIIDLYKGLLWTIIITSIDDSENQYKGRLVTTLTFNPRISNNRRE